MMIEPRLLTTIVLSLIVIVCLFRLYSSVDEERPSVSAAVSPVTPKHRHLEAKGEIDIEKAIEEAQKVLSLIRARYELDGPIGSNFFLTTQNIKADTWDFMKYKYLMKMFSDNDNEMLMIFGGSSVTAGHDSYYNQSYPYILKKRMLPILTAMGIDLVVHNIAQGANNCSPYQMCYESMGGTDPDFVGWEQSYNCGHDEAIFELAARVAGWSSRHATVYYSASGAWTPNDCEPSKEAVPYCDEDWHPDLVGIKAWNPSAQDLYKEKDLLNQFAQQKLSAKRFASYYDGGHDYFGVHPHGFNVWENNNMCKGRDKEDTKDITGCNGIDAAQKCKMKFMSVEASWYGKEDKRGANWHPSRAFHMLRGEAMTWIYTMALLDGLYEVQKVMKGKSPSPEEKQSLGKKYEEEFMKLVKPLPEPKKCQTYHCDAKPKCYTDYRPHYSKDMTLKDLIVGTTKWTYDDYEYGEWSLKYGYLDAKPLWSAVGDQGEMHLKVQVGNKAIVWICGAVKESLLHAKMYLDSNVPDDKLKGYTPSSNRKEWTKKKYVGNECKALEELPQGQHVISVSTQGAPEKHTTGLSHVIFWP